MTPKRRRSPGPTLYELAVRVRPEHVEDAVAWFSERRVAGLEERAARGGVELVLYGEHRPSLERSAKAAKAELSNAGLVSIRVRRSTAALAAWQTSWAEHLAPMRVTPRLVAVPTTCDVPRLPRGVRSIALEPALTFGFGEHPTTRLVARALEALCRRARPGGVLDVGTGSGILAFVAVMSGARRATGVDVDAEAVRAARKNAVRNGLAACCRFTTTPVSKIRGRFDVVVANIRLEPLVTLAPWVARAVAPGGFLLLSGVLVTERAAIARRYGAFGFGHARLPVSKSEEGWALVALRRRAGLR